MPLDVARLQVLVEVAHAGSIAAAARRMSFTPSALSQQLAKLEAEVGTRLVERGPLGIRLSDTGKILLEHGERVLGELREAEAAVSARLAGQPRHVALGTFATAGTVLVPAALAALRRDHPDVQLSLRDLEPPDGYGLVASGDLDLLITHRYPGMASTPVRGLIRRNLLIDPLRLVVPVDLAESSGPADVDLATLAEQPWVCGGFGVPNRVCLEYLAAPLGFRPRVSYETADYALTLALAGVGLGVALVPASVINHVRPTGVVIRDLAVRDRSGPRPAREICIVHRRRPSTLLQQLITLIGEAAIRTSSPPDARSASS
jgi:DNA-binding transcriptional LysR family regulator